MQGKNFGALVLLLLLYGLAVPVPTYVLSFYFKTAAMAQTAVMAGYTMLTLVRRTAASNVQ
jgi:hypothetical protein